MASSRNRAFNETREGDDLPVLVLVLEGWKHEGTTATATGAKYDLLLVRLSLRPAEATDDTAIHANRVPPWYWLPAGGARRGGEGEIGMLPMEKLIS